MLCCFLHQFDHYYWTELISAVYVSDLILVGSQVMIEIDSNKKFIP